MFVGFVVLTVAAGLALMIWAAFALERFLLRRQQRLQHRANIEAGLTVVKIQQVVDLGRCDWIVTYSDKTTLVIVNTRRSPVPWLMLPDDPIELG
jgi:hypothetical protein